MENGEHYQYCYLSTTAATAAKVTIFLGKLVLGTCDVFKRPDTIHAYLLFHLIQLS